MDETARAVIEVTAGLIPGTAQAEYTRRWWITSAEWQAANEVNLNAQPSLTAAASPVSHLLSDKQGPAMAYAQLLMLQPDALNWVRVEWVWF